MAQLFLAKTFEQKTIESHTLDLMYHYNYLKAYFPAFLSESVYQMLETAIWFHDIGKVNRRFQNKLYEKLSLPLMPLNDEAIDEIPHGYLSPCFMDVDAMDRNFGEEGTEIIITAVMMHHARDAFSKVMRENIKNVLLQELSEDIAEFPMTLPQYFNNRPTTDFYGISESMLNEPVLSEKAINYVKVKGYLNKLDYVASAFGQDSTIEKPHAVNGLTLDAMIIDAFQKNGHQLRALQAYLYENRNRSGIVIASTGLGKTEAALLWLSQSKGFFTLPLKVSINAIYERVKKTYGYTPVELVHSGMADYFLKESGQEDDYLEGDIGNRMNEARLFLSPLTVTTVDQIFKCVYLYNGFELILAQLSHSKIIIDEIQMYDSKILACLIRGLQLIKAYGGQYLVMTATLPEYVVSLMKSSGVIDKDAFFETFLLEAEQCEKRHLLKLEPHSTIPYDAICEQGEKRKVLVIANTVSAAKTIYQCLIDKKESQGMHAPVYLLHSQYIQRDRALLEAEVQAFTNAPEKQGVPGIWVATQIVEASLDIDFDELYTEMCSIDSFIQRMGRVYRRRYRSHEEGPNVIVLNTRNTGHDKVIDSEIYNASWRALTSYDGQWLIEQDKQAMINAVFNEALNPDIKKYKARVQTHLNELSALKLYDAAKKTVEATFREIDNVTCMPTEIYYELVKSGEFEKLMNALENRSNQTAYLEARETLMRHTLSLRRSQMKYYRQANDDMLIKYGVFITDCRYEFNETTRCGRGLLFDEANPEDAFL
ncbi:MAG: CRISPR-associated endonuclease/helicase Cas3 [Clostridiales bacterium]|nr:CRISPR-associated endonuclease/helicase Cas3 [Clostridiales bacterium]